MRTISSVSASVTAGPGLLWAIVSMGLCAFLTSCASGPELQPAVRQPPSQPAAPSDHLIVPGERIGPIALGMTDVEVLRIMGPPDDFLRVFSTHIWHDKGAAARIPRLTARIPSGRVVSVSTGSPTYSTAEGIAVGATELEMRARHGKPQKTSSQKDASNPPQIYRIAHCYPGVEFAFTTYVDRATGREVNQHLQRVSNIRVFPPREKC